jgi:acyl carrier protein phosphodiesterase
MNFLAHLFLSCEEEELLLGNFIADFIRNRDLASYSPGVRRGVRLHRSIDAYTDRHPAALRGARRLYPYHGKYAPVLIDIFYDHFLAVRWADYSQEALSEFAQRVYRALERHIELMPPLLRHRLPLMIADDWLLKYREMEGIAFALDRTRERASRPELLRGAIDSLRRDYEPLQTEFQLFFPQLRAYARDAC